MSSFAAQPVDAREEPLHSKLFTHASYSNEQSSMSAQD
jgi:hypothetical protein